MDKPKDCQICVCQGKPVPIKSHRHEFEEKIICLVSVLTGSSYKVIAQRKRIKKHPITPEKFLEIDFYDLLDGYSQIVYQTGKLVLNSPRDEVRKAWDRCKELIEDIEADLKKEEATWEE